MSSPHLRLGLQSDFLTRGFLTRFVCARLTISSPVHDIRPDHLILPELNTLAPLRSLLHSHTTSAGPHILLTTLFSHARNMSPFTPIKQIQL
jgi:hypothetical protein